MKIALIRPPKLLVKGTLSMKPAPPLGLAYIAGALLADGHEVNVVDAIAEGIEKFYDIGLADDIFMQGLAFDEIAERIPGDTRIIGMSFMFTNNWLLDNRLIDFIAAKFPDALLIAGGESITGMPEYALSQSRLHVCVMGEGEATACELAKAMEAGSDWKELSGIVYKNEGNIIKNKRRERIEGLDSIPTPVWQLFPVNLYFEHQITWAPTPARSLPMLATRGCPFSCTFCSSPQMWTTRYYLRSPKGILDEMIALNLEWGVSNFELFDLTAIVNRQWILEFCKIMQAHPKRFTWQMPAGTRSEALSSDVIHEMALAGCTSITFAPESASPELQKSMRKNSKPENMLAAMKTASEHKMYIHINIMLGLPGETHRDIWRTIFYLMRAAKAGADDTGAGMFMPYAGTVLFNELEKKGKIKLNEQFFYDILRIDTLFSNKVFNDNISPAAYRIYNLLYLILFYLTSFTFRPSRIYHLFKNVWRKTYLTRSEKVFGHLLEQLSMRAGVKRVAALGKEVRSN